MTNSCLIRALLVLAATAAMSALSDSALAASGGDCLQTRCAVTVSKTAFLRDGKPWIPKGVVITGFVAPKRYLTGTYLKARSAWGEALLRDVKEMGGDTIRINVSSAGLDPQNKMVDGRMTAAEKQSYLDEIEDAINLSRRFGMTVILTLLGGETAAGPGSAKVPGPTSERAWLVLANRFKSAPSVIFNAFNEPVFRGADQVDTDQSPWKRWSEGYKILVSAIRSTGAKNVILLNGLSLSRVWRKNSDALIPEDKLNQLAYDIHPFPTSSDQKDKAGNDKFEYLSVRHIEYWLDGWCDRHACIASAFFVGTSANQKVNHCFTNDKSGYSTPEIARNFVSYFTSKGIGMLIFAGDWSNRVFDRPGEPGAKLSTFVYFKECGGKDVNIGPGELMSQTWKSLK